MSVSSSHAFARFPHNPKELSWNPRYQVRWYGLPVDSLHLPPIASMAS
jgi:hypothetical protein